MIISPPFLLPRAANQTDEAWVDRCMTPAGEGGVYPLSKLFGWHGGMHIQAPITNNAPAAARAIADGTVVLVRAASAKPPGPVAISPDHPQNYTGRWTDNGVVVIRHDTEIGEGPNATVRFYSVYVHLRRIADGVAVNQPILRKAEIGIPGEIYGAAGQIHFEIVFGADQLERIVGRASGDLRVDASGRTDAVFGDMHFLLPAGTLVYPGAATARPSVDSLAPALPAGQAPHSLEGEHFAQLRYQSGAAIFTLHRNIAPPDQPVNFAPIAGAVHADAQGEYNLYQHASDLAAELAAANTLRAAARPVQTALPTVSASSFYELIRFGRRINTEEQEVPRTLAHWRHIRYGAGAAEVGWVNLNAEGVHAYSDADFPHWLNWTLIDEAADGDSRCDSPTIRGWVQNPDTPLPPEAARSDQNDGEVSDAELSQRAQVERIERRLKKALCKFPTEWDASQIDRQWGWLQDPVRTRDVLRQPMDFTAYGKFKAHMQALAFWDTSTGLAATHWHVHPAEFIKVFRGCAWLSMGEMAKTLPKHLFYASSGTPRIAITTAGSTYTLSLAQATNRIANHQPTLNRTINKYIGHDKKRIALFLAQVLLETAQWRNLGGSRRLMHEWGFGEYSAANPATQYYAAFYGRGIMQLTWAGNYVAYGNYRNLPNHNGSYTERLTATPRITATSMHYTANPNDGGTLMRWSPRYDPDTIGENTYAACDSGGFYWVSKPHSGSRNINRVCDRDYSPASVHRINILVNGGGNGYYERQAYSLYLIRLLTDAIETNAVELITPPAPKARVQANLEHPE